MKSNKHIGIIYTDISSDLKEKKNSTQEFVDLSESEYENGLGTIKSALESEGFDVTTFGVKKDLKELINYITEKKPDLIFNLCESYNHESINEMYIAGIYELLNIAYTGNKSWTLGTLIRKSKVKGMLKKYGYLTPEHQIINDLDNIKLNDNLKFPLIVKPSREDASVGINNLSIVNNIDDLRKQAEYVYKLVKQPILVEEYIEGRELNVAILGNENAEALPISEIDFSKLPADFPKIVTYSAKWHEESAEYKGTVGTCPAILDREVEQKLKTIALDVYSLFDCRGYVRVDFRLSKDNLPYILEINPNPDISDDAGFFRSAKNAGYTYSGMLKKIVELGFDCGAILS
jgi:D-alanine-D-alanine ligase